MSIYSGSEGYGTSEFCWLAPNQQFLLAFAAPSATIFLLHALCLLTAMCLLCRHSSDGYKPCKYDENVLQVVRSWFKSAALLGLLLGVTWTVAILWLVQRQVHVAILFSIFNASLGFFAFLLLVLCNDKVAYTVRNSHN